LSVNLIPVTQDLSVTIRPPQPEEFGSDAGTSPSDKSSKCSSALSSPSRGLPPHVDLPTLFKSEDVRENDSFLDMDDVVQGDVLESSADAKCDDGFDLAVALTRTKPSSFPFECEEDEEYYAYGDRPYEEIMQDRRMYLVSRYHVILRVFCVDRNVASIG